MGIFKKLFGISTEETSFNYDRNEHEGKAPQIKVETKSAKPEPIQSCNPYMTSWENFFGINLKKSPNEDWKFIETEHNNNKTISSYETYKLNDAYFSYVKALVIDSIATNFFFRCPYTRHDAFDIYFIIERDLIHKGNYTNIAAANKFHGKFDSKYDSFDWEIDGCSIIMSRDIDTGDIELGVWTNFYNKDYLDTHIEEGCTQIQGCDIKIKDNDASLSQKP